MSRTSYYQPLTAEAAALKRAWMPCINNCCRLQELQQEIQDVDGSEEVSDLQHERQAVGLELEKLRATVRELLAATDTLNSLERRVLRLRYLYADPWDAIAAQVGREASAVYTAHRKALNKVAEFVSGLPLDKAG